MSWGTFLRREWGAATFVVTVIVGLVAVPLALYFGHQAPSAVNVPTPTPTVASGPVTASSPATATPATIATPSKSP